MKKKKTVWDESIDGYDWYEGQPKWRPMRIAGAVFCAISALVWGIILFRIFSAQDRSYENMILLNQRAAAIYPEQTAQVLRIVPATAGEPDPAVMIYTPTYLAEAENFQLTVRLRTKLFPAPSDTLPAGYRFVLRERGEETRDFPLSYFQLQKRFGYAFYRLAFETVSFSEEKEYVLLIYSAASDQDPAFSSVLYDAASYAHTTTPQKSAFVLAE